MAVWKWSSQPVSGPEDKKRRFAREEGILPPDWNTEILLEFPGYRPALLHNDVSQPFK